MRTAADFQVPLIRANEDYAQAIAFSKTEALPAAARWVRCVV